MQKTILFFLLLSATTKAQTPLAVADSLYALGNYTKAIKLYQEQQPQTAYGLSKIGQAYNQLSAYHKAIPFYEKSIKKDSTLLITQYELARLYTKTRAFTKADSLFNKLIVKDNSNPNFHYQLGRVQLLNKNGNYINSFKKAVAVDAHHLKSIKQLCQQFLKRKKWALFDHYLNLGMKEYPKNEMLTNYKAQGYFNRKHYKKAITYFSKLNKTNQKNEFVLLRLALSHYALQEYEKALFYNTQLLKIDAKNGAYHSETGKTYFALKDYKNATYKFMTALRLNKKFVDNDIYNIAMVYKAEKKYGIAIKTFKGALKENPYNHKAQFELAVCGDNYYKDAAQKLKLYQIYKLSFEGENKRYDEIVAARIRYFKTQLHLERK